jgi:hypothetical protein
MCLRLFGDAEEPGRDEVVYYIFIFLAITTFGHYMFYFKFALAQYSFLQQNVQF